MKFDKFRGMPGRRCVSFLFVLSVRFNCELFSRNEVYLEGKLKYEIISKHVN